MTKVKLRKRKRNIKIRPLTFYRMNPIKYLKKQKIMMMSTPLSNDDYFKEYYLGDFIPSNEIQNRCGDCVFFDNGCTTSELENKYGDAKTPACSDFKQKESSS